MSAGEEAINSPEAAESINGVGEIVDEIPIEIDYAIIEHFSEHLYGSPNKAIEELVSNGFDAFASRAYVYLPGRFARDRVLVWDDGDSMDVEDLKKLWWIARSPKNVGERIVESADGRTRAMIGKFGIGKLASYAVGHRIAHLCRRGGSFFHVAVDYREVPPLEEGEARKTHRVAVRELEEEEARDYVSSLFDADADAFDTVWGEDSWTLAIIDELKEGVSLTGGRLRWVLGNGMPLRPDFNVWVDDEEVEPKLGKDAAVSWDLSETKLLEAIASAWKTARQKGQVDGEYEVLDTANTESGKPAVRMPELGEVRAEVLLFERSLLGKDPAEEPRSHGFFVMVRDRLLNPDEGRLLLPDPSFGAFYRCQFVLHADGLDRDLLADRERLRPGTPRSKELVVLQRALYLASRNELEAMDENREQAERSESLLPVESREYFRQPLTALLLRNEQHSLKPTDLAKARIERTLLAETAPLSALDAKGELQVNTAHPLFESVKTRLGENKVAKKALQVLDLFAVSERLLEGFLYDLGLSDEQTERVLDWRDGLFRAIATRFNAKPLEEVVREVRETSYKGLRG